LAKPVTPEPIEIEKPPVRCGEGGSVVSSAF